MRVIPLICSVATALGLAALMPDTASAQGACTGAPGEMVVGMAGGGPGGYQTPLCASGGGGAAGTPRRSDGEVMNDNISTAYNADLSIMMMGLFLMKNELDKRQNGFWEHMGPANTVERGYKSCSAIYLKGSHFLMLWGSNKPGAQATLTLVDANEDAAILPLEVPEVQQVTLEQTGAAPATTNAIRHAVDGYGAVTFAIPSLELAVSGLRDEMSIRVSGDDGQELLAMDYSDGFGAKFWFENCIRKLPRPRVR